MVAFPLGVEGRALEFAVRRSWEFRAYNFSVEFTAGARRGYLASFVGVGPAATF